MKVTHIPFQKTDFFSKIMTDYLEKKELLKPYYNNFPDLNGFQKQIQEKEISVQPELRNILVDVLKSQYKNTKTSAETEHNIKLLLKSNTFTVTTGHQLNIFTGPLYFLYKIISTINLCEELQEEFPRRNFVPIYWMATEDHDFEEINYFNFKGDKIKWNRANGGAVGQFSTDGLQAVFEKFSTQLGNSKNAKYLKELFEKAYINHEDLSSATRYITNELFAKYGLVIIDGDDKKLKKSFIPYLKNELIEGTSYKSVSKTISSLEKLYKIQVNPRKINLFYLSKNSRERIIKQDNRYLVNNTDISFSEEEIVKILCETPELFSPNVIMRPLYQEVVLPNLCYIGGGGELAYWLELKKYFDNSSVPFPILLLRNSVQTISKNQKKKLNNLNINIKEVFIKQKDLLPIKVIENSDIDISFSKQKEQLKEQFKKLKRTAKKTDISFLGAVNAQEKKQINGLNYLEKRLLRAEKRRQQDLVLRITELQNQLFPNGDLEERQCNFSDYYLEYGEEFIEALKKSLKPLQLEFTVLEF